MNSYNGFTSEKRMEVHRWLRAEEAAGRLVWPTECEACGQTQGIFDCHHENYDEPLSYVGLCYLCHLMLHCRFSNAEAWRRYGEAIGRGVRYQPLFTRNFGIVRALLAGEAVAFTLYEPPLQDLFSRILWTK